MSILEAALAYAQMGYSVIPVGIDKRPPILWECYQHQRASPAVIKGWYSIYPDAGVAIVTGVISGIFVVDVDPRHGGDLAPYGLMPATFTVHTGGGGWHFYFKGVQPCRTAVVPGVDIKGEGGYVVAPPSGHPSGGKYTIEVDTEPTIPPAWLPRLITRARQEGNGKGQSWVSEALAGVPKKKRDTTCIALAGYFRALLPADVTLTILSFWGQRCEPPFGPKEIIKCVNSAYGYPGGKSEKGKWKGIDLA